MQQVADKPEKRPSDTISYSVESQVKLCTVYFVQGEGVLKSWEKSRDTSYFQLNMFVCVALDVEVNMMYWRPRGT